MADVQPIPEGFNSVNVYLTVPNAKEAIAFYQKAFNAKPGIHMPGPDGEGTAHAEFHIGNSTVMIGDENPACGSKSPATLGGTAVGMLIYLDDVDTIFQQAVEAGCEVERPLVDMFWGDRMGCLNDPFGHNWSVATHIEDVPADQMEARQQEWLASMAQCAEA